MIPSRSKTEWLKEKRLKVLQWPAETGWNAVLGLQESSMNWSKAVDKNGPQQLINIYRKWLLQLIEAKSYHKTAGGVLRTRIFSPHYCIHYTVYTQIHILALWVTKQECEDVFGKQKIAAEVCVWASVWKSHSRLQWLKYFHLQNAHSNILCLPALRND